MESMGVTPPYKISRFHRESQKMKRLTLDLPEGLHRAIKRRAVEEGVTMVDMLRTLLEEQYDTR